MTTLRVLLAQAPSPDREVDWALFDATGACADSGRARPGTLPRVDRLEVVIAAAQVRIASVVLPRMAASRVTGAARFALEDQLAGPAQAPHLAVSSQAPDGRVCVTIVDGALLETIAGAHVLPTRPARIVAEPDLAAVSTGWRWCAGPNGDGFIRCSDGSAFAVDAPDGTGALPSELALALARAKHAGTAPDELLVDAPFDAALIARWQRETGVAFRRGTPWLWHRAPAAAFSAAVDLAMRPERSAPAAERAGRVRLFAPALWIAVAALALNVVATTVEWAALKLDMWRNAREWTALATGAGIDPEAAASPASARAALVRRHAELRHSHLLPAPDDALPLLARAAPALAALPQGAVKSASYADGHWTLDLVRSDAAALADVDARLRQAGVPALTATGPAGVRMRFGRS